MAPDQTCKAMFRSFPLLFILLFLTGQLCAQQQPAYKNITVKEDPQIEQYYKKAAAANAIPATTAAQSTKGFRVQIYNGNDRTKASEAKMKFIKKHPGIRSYIVFNNPQYRVRVGDFTTREDAETFREKLQNDFQPTMVIPDLINVSGKTHK